MHQFATFADSIPRRSAMLIGGGALGLGLAGDLLLRATPWGINVTLFVLVLGAAAVLLAMATELSLPRSFVWLAPATLFAALFPVRASETVQALCLLALVTCLLMASFAAPKQSARAAGLTRLAAHMVIAAALSLGSLAPVLVHRVDYRMGIASPHLRAAPAVVRGLLIAIPVAALFATLFAAADVFFRDFLSGLVAFDAGTLASHIGFTLLIGWLAGSYVTSLLTVRADRDAVLHVPDRLRIGAIETAILFALVNVVFAVFVILQFRYLFGGPGRVEASSTLTFADYARRGFFELVTVTALVVVLLLAAHWLLADGRRARRMFAVLAGILLVLVVVVMASALERMRLYTQNYGLTELRVYTTIFMGWLALLLAWMAVTLLPGRRDHFAFGGMLGGFAVVGFVAVANVDAFIVRQNVRRDGPEHAVDVDYILDLGPDGVPALLGMLGEIPEAERCRVVTTLHDRYAGRSHDWRTWNYGRWRAVGAARDHAVSAGGCTTPE